MNWNPVDAWNHCVDNASVPGAQVATVQCLIPLFESFVVAALTFVGALALIFVIISGIRMIVSGGDAKQLETARKTLTWAIIGLLVVVFSFAIVGIIGTLTGVNCIQQVSFTKCK